MTVRVGVIGVGSIGTAHATSLAREISGATVSVVYDFDAARAAALATDLGARSVAAPHEVFDADDVDAVLIASPDAVHAEQLMLGLKAGKLILCEKPLATSGPRPRPCSTPKWRWGVGSSKWALCAASTPDTRGSNRSSPLIGSVTP